MDNRIFTYPLTIKETNLDTFGHVNNATYLTLLEEARWDLLNKNGFGLETIKQTQLGPTILDIHIRFLKELRARDEIVIETQLISYEGKIGRLLQRMLRDGEECCTAEFVIGLFSVKERKLVIPTEQWLKAIS